MEEGKQEFKKQGRCVFTGKCKQPNLRTAARIEKKHREASM
jgi:hypothetical protein